MGAFWFSKRFYQVAAVCSLLAAFTTLVLIFAPSAWSDVKDFEARVALPKMGAYRFYIYVHFLHPFLVFVAALALAERLRKQSNACALFGILAFGLWACTEAGQHALTMFARDEWRLLYLGTTDEHARANLKIQLATTRGIWDAMYFLIVVAFFLANSLLAAAAYRSEEGPTRVLAVALTLVALHTLSLIVVELKGPPLPETVGSLLYPLIGPPTRALLAWWLWQEASEAPA